MTSVLLLLAAACGRGTTPSPGVPDLVASTFRLTDSRWTAIGTFEADVEIVVENVGDGEASDFELAVVGLNQAGGTVAFAFLDEPDRSFSLPAGHELLVSGTIGLGWHGHFDITCAEASYDAERCAMNDEDSILLMAVVDACDPLDRHCSVVESDETNNASTQVRVERGG